MCIKVVNGTVIPNYERMSPPLLTVDSIAVFSAVIIMTYLVILLLNRKKPCVAKIGKCYKLKSYTS